MYCIKCGSDERTYGNLCEKCLIDDRELVKVPPYVKRIICPECGDYLIGSSSWVRPFDGMQTIVENNLEFDKLVSDPSIDFDEFPEGTNEFQIELSVEINIEELFLEIPLSFKLRTKKQVCDVCSRKRGGYFEAIIQIRGDGRDPSDSDMEGISRFLNKSLDENKSDRQAFLTKESKVKGGTDYYMGSSGLSKSQVRDLQSRFGGKVTETSRIFGQNDGKDVFRYTYSLRLPKMRKDDIVSDKKDTYIVTSVSKNFAFLKDLNTWGKKKIRYDEFNKFTVNMGGYTISKAVIIHEGEKEIQIMDPVTFKPITIKKPQDYISEGQETTIIKIDDDMYLI